MTQGYRGRSERSRRLDMNWLNFGMLVPCARGTAGSEVVLARGDAGPSASREFAAGYTAASAPRRGAVRAPGRTVHAPRHKSRPNREAARSGRSAQPPRRACAPPRSLRPRPRTTAGTRTAARAGSAPDTHDAPATRKVGGGVERMPGTRRGARAGASRGRGRSRGAAGRSLRLAERPPRSGRSSISLPLMRVSARLSSTSLREVGRQLDEREVRPDLDRAEVVAAQAALVRERADDLARLDLAGACRPRCGRSRIGRRRAARRSGRSPRSSRSPRSPRHRGRRGPGRGCASVAVDARARGAAARSSSAESSSGVSPWATTARAAATSASGTSWCST